MFALEESEKVVLEKESKKELTVGVKLDGKWEIQVRGFLLSWLGLSGLMRRLVVSFLLI